MEKEREAEKLAKAEAQRQAAEKKKKKPIRYPTEDLDVTLSEKERKNGTKVRRPVPSRNALPFNDREGSFESFLMAWNFLIVYGCGLYALAFLAPDQCHDSQPLHLSTFTLDEFEHAIRHTLTEPPCPLIAEVHSSLIYNLRTVTFQRHSAVVSLMKASEEDGEEDLGVTVKELTTAMADVGNNWERTPLRNNEGREGWEESLVGCIKDVRLFNIGSTNTNSCTACNLLKLPNSATSVNSPAFRTRAFIRSFGRLTNF